MAYELTERVSDLEALLGSFMMQTEKAIIEMRRDTLALKLEMSDFKNEMSDFKEEMRASKKDMDKKWGDLANKMGTLVEDIVAPNIPRIARQYFDCEELDDFGVRRIIKNKKDKTKKREFDIIAVSDKYLFINETKSTARTHYIDDFRESLKDIFDYFPEYKKLKIIPILSCLYMDDLFVKKLTENNIYAMAMKDDTMEILNASIIK